LQRRELIAQPAYAFLEGRRVTGSRSRGVRSSAWACSIARLRACDSRAASRNAWTGSLAGGFRGALGTPDPSFFDAIAIVVLGVGGRRRTRYAPPLR